MNTSEIPATEPTEVPVNLGEFRMPRADRRRGEKYIAKLQQYQKSKFQEGRIRLQEPIVGSDRAYRDHKHPELGTRAFTPKEIDDRAIERFRARGIVPTLRYRHQLKSSRANPTRIKHRMLAELISEHAHFMNKAIGISPKYKGRGYDRNTAAWDKLQKEWLKAHPVPTMQTVDALFEAGTH